MVWAWDIDTPLPDFARRYARHALAHGLLLRPIGHTLYTMPPYCLTDADAAPLGQAALAALDATLADEDQDSAAPPRPATEARDGV
jgi:adenosylmethionine---8-amino-7-oxononanoate aminotransferase